MSISRNLSKLGTNTNSSGTLQVTGGGTGVTVSTGSGALTLNTDPTFSGNISVRADGNFGTADGPTLGGMPNPIVTMVANSNNYVESYIVNYNNGTFASSDIVCYPINGTDAAGWIDMGITSNTYNQAAYSVTGPNEGYLFMSAPSGSSTSGNLVLATDSTGTYNSIQFYAGGFNQAKSTFDFQISSTSTFSLNKFGIGITPVSTLDVGGTANTGALTSTSASITDVSDSTSISSGALKVSGGMAVTKNVYIGGNLNVTGNVFFNGNTVIISGNNLSVNDSLIYMAADNPANLFDIGLVGHFTTSKYQHCGLIRDHTDGIWKLFSNVVSEPSGSTIDLTNANYDDYKAGNIFGNNYISLGATSGQTWLRASAVAGNTSLTLPAANGVLISNVDLTTLTNLTSAAGTGLNIQSGTTGTLYLDSTSTGSINIGTSAQAKTITIGNLTGATKIVANTGTGGFWINTPAAGQVSIYPTAIPTADIFNINNYSFGVTTAGVSAMQITYYGGAAAIETSVNRVDVAAGNTAAGIWNAFRVAPYYGAATGVTQNAFKANTIVAGAGTDNVLYVGTGWDNIINYNGTSVINGLGQLVVANVTNTLQSTLPPIQIFPNTAIASAVAGGIEYDSKRFFASPATANAAVIKALHYYKTNAAITLANTATAQAWLGVGVALQANTTYEFEGQFNLATTGTLTHTESHLFAYTGVIINTGYQINRFNNATTGALANSVYATSISSTTITPAIVTAQSATYQIKGVLITSTAGRLTPQIVFSAAPGGTSTVASLANFKIFPVDYGNANTVIGNWA